MEMKWHDDFCISVKTENGTTQISANREGLLSLADFLTTLADEQPGCHFHLDVWNALEDGSDELIVEKI